MRLFVGFFGALALGLVGCSDSSDMGGGGGVGGQGGDGGSGPPAFQAGLPVEVSGASTFDDCTADANPDAMLAPAAEVEPWIVVDPTDPDHIAAVWKQDRYTAGGGSRGHVAGVSFDGGATWESTVIPGLTPCSGGDWERTTDPWLAFGANGDLYSVSLSFDSEIPYGGAILVNRSTDGGRTWNDPVVVHEAPEPEYNDRETITADPVEACTIYTTWTRFDQDPVMITTGDVVFSRSTDCGSTWTEPVVVHRSRPVGIAAQIVVSPDGALLAFFKQTRRDGEERPIWVKRSTDGGATWPGEPTVIDGAPLSVLVTPDEGRNIRTASYDVAVDRQSGDLYVVWEHLFGELFPHRVAFSSSNDGGLTWSEPIRVDQTPPGSSFPLEQAVLPSVEVSDDGTIGVTYYNFENDTAGSPPSETDYWFTHCHPDYTDCTVPESWNGALRLTPSSFDYLRAPDITTGSQGLFLGDYVGLAPSGNDFVAFFSATTDTDPANTYFVPIRAR